MKPVADPAASTANVTARGTLALPPAAAAAPPPAPPSPVAAPAAPPPDVTACLVGSELMKSMASEWKSIWKEQNSVYK